MPRYAMRIEYDGRPFAGWQRQDGPDSVQQRLEEALRALDPTVPSIAAAGRTDAGVHATGQVAHADLSKDWSAFRLSEAVNWHLKPMPIAVTACAPVDDDWHARFSALERRYTFRIIARRAPLTLDAGQAWRVIGPLNVDAMREGAKHLIGLHDFTTFRASICQAKSPVKTLDEITIEEAPYPGGQDIRLHIRARSFLHNQVRSIAGTLERVGAGSWPPDRVAEALAARNRAACGPVSPPDGLVLTGVGYEADPFVS
ncbi:tRNA pseudouridine synthase A [Jannaschia pagri]|uniref:tRNA pseudouridine synthase A n=1 Tax=Jannaschia pagri TaxID=2829797 RepID=A0ABQ4NI36_9RHOB|nr:MULTISPECIES: tRNA pseudouridine(38-40) synthase TruA [unclassified Jannaschia]GIT89805.1 tRNA pseudouridine synthase A [Jannaschia sp. AI_61]GIT94087.1 tRNA pseudouridine synthase A [Jannaschia sp. AI_62]